MAKKISDLDQLSADQAQDAADTQYKPDWTREDRPNYGVLGHKAHEDIYNKWRSTSRIPDLPAWHEMDNSSKAVWMGSQHGRKLIGDANRALKSTNYSEQAGRAVQYGQGESRNAVTNPTRQAEKRARAGVRSAVSSAPEIAPSEAGSIQSPFAINNDYSHHQNLGNVVDKLESSHNGGNSSVTPLATAARKSISDSIYSHGLGKREDAIKHFTDAAGHTMRLAQAVNGAAHNAGEATSALSSMNEAGSHLANYRTMVEGVKKVNQY